MELDMLSVVDQAPTAGVFDGIIANTGTLPANATTNNEDTTNDPDDSLDRDPDVIAAIQAQNQASAELIAHRKAVKAKYLADIRVKTAELVSLKKKSFTSGPTPFSTGAATLNPHRSLYRVRQPALTAGNRPNAPLPSPHDYESNFDTSHLDTLTLNAQVIHENLVANSTPHARSQPTTGPYHPSMGRVPPAARHTPRPPTPAPENPSLSGAARNHAGQGVTVRPGPDDPVLDRFPRDDERDFADAVANFTTLKQHELEHSATAGQFSADPGGVIKAEAKIINGLLKAIAPYHYIVDSCLQDTTTLLNINLEAIEDCVLFRSHSCPTRSQRPDTIDRVPKPRHYDPNFRVSIGPAGARLPWCGQRFQSGALPRYLI